MTTTASDPQIVLRPPASVPALRAADVGVADALESVLSDNTKRVYAAHMSGPATSPPAGTGACARR